jgi:ABC-2 type transport system permease protein
LRSAIVLAVKDLRILLRDRIALFWVLGFPLVFAGFFGAVLSEAIAGDIALLPVRVVDEAGGEDAARFVTFIERADALELRPSTLESARRDVRQGEAIAYVRIPGGFTIDEGVVELGVDPSRRTEALMIERVVGDAVSALEGWAPASTMGRLQRAEIEASPRSPFELVFPAATLWGLIGCASAFAVSLVSERRRGTLARLRAAPMGLGAILGGKALSCFVACATTAGVLFAVGHVLLGIRAESPLALVVVTACIALCFVGITLALSTLGTSEQSVAGAGWSVLIVMAMLGGAMVPLELMPEWLVRASDLSPVKWGIVALEGAMWRGLAPSALVKPCVILVLVGAAGLLAGLARLSYLARRGAIP